MLTNNVRDSLSASAEKLMDAQNQSSSGKRILRPSDDIAGTGRAMNLRRAIQNFDQYKRNLDLQKGRLTMTSNSLNTVTKSLQEVNRLALSAANPSLTGTSRTAIAGQLDQLMETLKGESNAKYMGQYIFSGSKTDTQPITASTSGTAPYVYNGDDVKTTLQVSPGVYMQGNITADTVFNMGSAAIPGTSDVFSSIAALKQDILSGDTEAISSRTTEITDNLNNVLGLNSQVGGMIKKMESLDTSMATSKDEVTNLLSTTEDVDLADAVVNLNIRNNVYQAAISTASKIMSISLADYLK